MSLLPPLPPTFEAALRDVRARAPSFRVAAAKRLGDPEASRIDEAREGLAVLVGDSVPQVRVAAAGSLGELARLDATVAERALPALQHALADDVLEVGIAAAAALGRARAPTAALALRSAASREEAAIRVEAILGLAGLAVDGVEASDVTTIAAAVADSAPEVREAAAIALRALGPAAHVGALVPLLADASPAVRAVAALALADAGDPRAAPALRACIEQRSPWIFEAIEAVAALRDERSRGLLRSLAEGFFTPSLVRAAAGAALVALGDDAGVDALRRALRSFFHDGRSYAVERAGALGVAALVPELAALVRRPRGVDPAALALALRALADASPAARHALDALLGRADAAGETARQAVASLPP